MPTFIGEVNPLSSPLPSYSIVLVAVATAVYVLFYAALIMVTFFFFGSIGTAFKVDQNIRMAESD